MRLARDSDPGEPDPGWHADWRPDYWTFSPRPYNFALRATAGGTLGRVHRTGFELK